MDGSAADARWSGTMPDEYDRLLGPVLFEPFAAELAARLSGVRPRRVLELAAGSGIVTRALVAALPDAEVVATDLNPAMVALGSRRVPAATWRQADAQALDLPAGGFDAVVCSFGLMFFPDKPGAAAQVRRVLVDDGALVATVWDRAGTHVFVAALSATLAEVLPDRTPDFVSRVPHGYADPDRIRADLAAGGLCDVEVDRVVLPARAPSAASVAAGFCRGTPLRGELEDRGPLDQLVDAVAAGMTARLGDGPVEGDQAAFVVTARRGAGPPRG